jgi:non-ribosomal peptide synthetase component F/thioesterase domain-containing protein
MESELTDPVGATNVEPVQASTEFPCSVAQERFWLLDRLEPGSPSYSVAVRWRLEGRISTSLLEQAWLTIIGRHEVLRTVFPERDGKPVQRVLAVSAFRLTEIDLTGMPVEAREAECDRIGLMEARAPFDLTTGPLVRVTLVRMAASSAILLVTTHQVVSDGWSIGVMAREMGLIYEALSFNRPVSLPELSIQYGDYASWQLEWLRARGTATEESYWTRQLAGVRPFQVPPDLPRPDRPTTHGAIASLVLPRELTNRAQALSHDAGATLFAAALAALCATLSRFTQKDEVVLGTQVSARDQVELEPMIGQFVNSLVLRNDLGDDPTFGELIGRVHRTTTEALEHRHISIERLLAMVKAERAATQSAAISVNFIFQRSFIHNATYGALTLVDMPSLPAGAIYDLNFFMVERPDGWRLSCQYNTDQFQAHTAERLLRYAQSALESGVSRPNAKISELQLCDPSEAQQVLARLHENVDEHAPAESLSALLDSRCAATPDAIAVEAGHTRLTYRQLQEHAELLAQRLRRQGIVAGSTVALYLPRGLDHVVAALAVLRAGAAYIGLDPRDPAAWTRYCVQASGARFVILRERAPAADTFQGRLLIDLASKEDARVSSAGGAERLAVSGESPALVAMSFDQGAEARASALSHRSLISLLGSLARHPGIAAHDGLIWSSPTTALLAPIGMWLALSVGARLIIAPTDSTGSAKATGRLLKSNGGTVLVTSAGELAELYESGFDTAGLKVLCDGDAAGSHVASAAQRRTEQWTLRRWRESGGCWALALADSSRLPTLGLPLASARFQLIDRAGHVPPLGATAELYVSGDSPAAQAQYTRTGELARLKPDGHIESLGRTDRHFLRRGHLVHPALIERELGKHPQVLEAAVTARRDPERPTDHLEAFVVLRGSPADPQSVARDIGASLARSLPQWLRPSVIEPVDAFPRTRESEVDYEALRHLNSRGHAAGHAAPANALEARLMAIWGELLEVEQIAATANFFELGGHSLLAARMLTRVESAFGRRITLATLFRSPTVRGLAQALSSETRPFDFRQVVKLQTDGSRPPIIAINNTGIYYLLAKQLGPDQPFTSLQLFDPSLQNDGMPKTLEQVAALYVELIRRAQPDGPYVLMGWCVAGALTFEIARQLVATGGRVSNLLLMDSWVPRYFARLRPWRRLVGEASIRWQIVRADWRAVRERRQSLRSFFENRTTVKRVRRAFGSGPPTGAPSETCPARPEDFDLWLLHYLQAVTSRYEPKLYTGRVTLFRSRREPTGWLFDPYAGWSPFVREGIDLVMVDGDHFSMFQQPGVAQIAAHMRSPSRVPDRVG